MNGSSSHDSPAGELAALEARINALLPPRYVGCFEEVAPSSMGSAALRYDSQGRVVWGEIWTTFCHLALAGGPPHRGRWLGPVAAAQVRAAPERYDEVTAELRRALGLCAPLPPGDQRRPGWIDLRCKTAATAAWLVRAIVAENVAARHEGPTLFVPAGPEFRIEKEIKNVVVCVAKTCHYLFDHLEPEQQPMGEPPMLIGPPTAEEWTSAGDRYAAAAATLRAKTEQATGLTTTLGEAAGWVGVPLESEEAAVWLLRAVAVEDVLVRREGATLFVPVDQRREPCDALAKTAAAVAGAYRLWKFRTKHGPM